MEGREQRDHRVCPFSPQCHPPAPLLSILQTHIKRTKVQVDVHTCSALTALRWCSLEVKELHPMVCSRLEEDSLKGWQAPGHQTRLQHFIPRTIILPHVHLHICQCVFQKLQKPYLAPLSILQFLPLTKQEKTSWNTAQLTHAQAYKNYPSQTHLLPSVHSPAYLWREGSACLPYRPPAVEAPAWCFRFHPAAGGHACAQCPLSTASSARPFCSGAASYKTGGFLSPAGKRMLKSRQDRHNTSPQGTFLQHQRL